MSEPLDPDPMDYLRMEEESDAPQGQGPEMDLGDWIRQREETMSQTDHETPDRMAGALMSCIEPYLYDPDPGIDGYTRDELVSSR